MITIDRPSAFFLLFLLIPAGLLMFLRLRKLLVSLGGLYGNKTAHNQLVFRRLRRAFTLKVLFRGAFWFFLVFAGAGIFWGKNTVPVQKSGNSVCFVFDISYSMNARDAGKGLTRLEAARHYAQSLIDAMQHPSVSMVLAKGDGILVLPLTEDRAAMQSLLDALSPALMTAAGSSIGKGISTALHSFPHNFGQAAHVWVFTDGDETDNSLQAALEDGVHYGIPVTLIGFGSEAGAQVLAGDGKTWVQTALKAEKMRFACDRANEKNVLPARKNQSALIRYVLSTDAGSAHQLLRPLEQESLTYSYEVQRVDRHGLFLLIAILCFIASFIVGEIDVLSLRHVSSALIVIVPLLCMSCNMTDSTAILKGTWAWYQKKYQQATSLFLQTRQNALSNQDEEMEQYALLGLSSTYLAQEEYEAALRRLEQIAPTAPLELKSVALYNQGIIAHHNGDNAQAIALFKEAILADETNVNAKINLELCQTEEASRQSQGAETEMQRVGEGKDDSALEKGIFTLIKENEQNQWKKMQTNTKDSAATDY